MENIISYFKSKYITMIGFMIPIIAYSMIFLAISQASWFTWQGNALSDLGAHPGTDIIFNTGLMISGILFVIFSIGLLCYFTDILERLGALILIFAGISLFNIGLFPETAGHIHWQVSVMFFVSLPFGVIFVSLANLKKDKSILITGAFVFIASLIIWTFPWHSVGVTNVAIPELLSSLCGVIWVELVAYKIFKTQNT